MASYFTALCKKDLRLKNDADWFKKKRKIKKKLLFIHC